MYEASLKLTEEIKELTELVVRKTPLESIETMDGWEFEAMQKTIGITRLMNEVILKQAQLMESIDAKLDVLLAKVEAR